MTIGQRCQQRNALLGQDVVGGVDLLQRDLELGQPVGATDHIPVITVFSGFFLLASCRSKADAALDSRRQLQR